MTFSDTGRTPALDHLPKSALRAAPPLSHGGLLRMALPIVVVSLSTPLVGAVDTAVLGHTNDPALVGGVAAAAVIVTFVLVAFNFLRTSTTAMVAQAFGAEDNIEMAAVVLRSAALAVLVGLLASVLQQVITHYGLELLALNGAVRRAAAEYLSIRLWSAPLMLLNFCIVGGLFGRGNFLAGMAMQILLNAVNIIVSVVLVHYWGWGAAGAAWGAVAGELCAVAMGTAVLGAILWQNFRPALERLRDLTKLRALLLFNSDVMIRSVTLFLIFAVMTRQGAQFGTVVFAANVVLLNLFYFSAAIQDGFATAAQQLAGRSVGRRDPVAFRRADSLISLWGAILALAATLLLFLARDFLIGVMSKNGAVNDAASEFYLWLLLAPLVGTQAFVLDGVFAGAGWSRDMRNMMLISVACFFAALSVLLPSFGNHGLWIAFLLFLAVRGASLRLRLKGAVLKTFRLA